MAQTAIRIVTDTTATLPPGYAKAHHVEVVPQIIYLGQESYLEEVELTYPDFVRYVRTSRHLPKTAAPATGDFVKAYERQLAQAQTVISLHPTAEASGTVRSALTAKEASCPEADVRIVDSRTVAGNLATLVMLAVEWAESGIDADEIVRRIRELIPRGRIYFLVATLEYLQKGGRIGGAQSLIGSALQVKPILELKEGRVEPLERVRTYHRALGRLKELVFEQCPRTAEAHLCVMHADAEDQARLLAQDLEQALGLREIPLYSVGAAITTHAGPGTLGVGFFV